MYRPTPPALSHNMSQRDREFTMQAYTIHHGIAVVFGEAHPYIRNIMMYYCRTQKGSVDITYYVFVDDSAIPYIHLSQSLSAISFEACYDFLEKNIPLIHERIKDYSDKIKRSHLEMVPE